MGKRDRKTAGDDSRPEGGGACGWDQVLLLREFLRHADEAEARLKGTLCQTHAVFLSICLPLTLGQVEAGETRSLLLRATLFSALSLPAGLALMRLEASRARRLAERNDRGRRNWKGQVFVSEPPGLFELLLESVLYLATGAACLFLLVGIAHMLGWIS